MVVYIIKVMIKIKPWVTGVYKPYLTGLYFWDPVLRNYNLAAGFKHFFNVHP